MINGCVPSCASISKIGPYNLGRTIGKGNFAVVKVARHEITKSKVAVKIVDKTCIDEENLLKIYREIDILKKMKHPHIIKLYQVMESETKLFLVTEYAGAGEVFEYLRKNSRMNENEARRVFKQMLSAVAYCHSMGVVHRDLKAENVLFTEDMDIKLVDFGFSNYANEDTLLQTWCGSPPYAAPELFLGEKYCGQKSDVWSLGVVLYILVCGGFPFPSSSIERLRNAVLDGHISIPFYVSTECADLIRRMLVVNPRQRFTIRQILQHRWFTAHDWNEEWSELFTMSLQAGKFALSATLQQNNMNEDEFLLNYACVAYMQQRGFSADKVTDSVLNRRFNDEYAAYHLLCDKLMKNNPSCPKMGLLANQQILCNGSGGIQNGPPGINTERRGSRGSITTGRVDMEPGTETPLISSMDLAKLGMSSSDEDSASVESDDFVAEPCGPSGIQAYLAQRRHTALGVVPVTSPFGMAAAAMASTSGNVLIPPQLPLVPFPLQAAIMGEMANVNLHAVAVAAALGGAAVGFRPNPLLMPRLMPPFGQQRSQSIADSALAACAAAAAAYNFLGQQPNLAATGGVPSFTGHFLPHPNMNSGHFGFPSMDHLQTMVQSAQQQYAFPPLNLNVEDAGAHYLKSRSGAKRHTIHSMTSSPPGINTEQQQHQQYQPGASAGGKLPRQYSPTSSGGQGTSSVTRRAEPYVTAPRRSAANALSAAAAGEMSSAQQSAHLSADALRHLERLYQNALNRSESPADNIRHLQHEFQQLRPNDANFVAVSPIMSIPTSSSLNCDQWRSSPRSSPPTQTLDMIAEHDVMEDHVHHQNQSIIATPLFPSSGQSSSRNNNNNQSATATPPPTIQITSAGGGGY